MSPPQTDLLDRVAALRAVVTGGRDLLSGETLEEAADLVRRADARLRHGTDFTVVALAGATGSGKSSLFNALAGDAVSPVGVMRPTTAHARAAVFGETSPDALLAWLEVRHRHAIAPGELDGLVLLDLPDHDSIAMDHRLEVDRLVELVDVLMWVLDPQKYADEVLHVRYLAALAGHADSMVFLLNQTDLVPVHDRTRWADHAASVLAADGITSPVMYLTSAVTGQGIAELRTMLRGRIDSRTASLERLDADLRRMSDNFGTIPRPGRGADQSLRSLCRDLSSAAGAEVVADAVAAGYRFDAAKRTGWPFARWLLRFRRHPLRALRPAAPASDPEGPQRPTSIPIDHPRLDLAIRSYADGRSGDADPRWARRARSEAATRADELPAVLGAAVRGVAQSAVTPPRWWQRVGGVQRLFAGIAILGALWLLGLAVLSYLKVPVDDVTPHVGNWPVPTLLLLGGGAAGFLLGLLAGFVAHLGAGRRAKRATVALADRVAGIADEYVVTPLDAELARWDELAHNLAVTAGAASPADRVV
jgi:GTP-binding protein EngB required for normal cell division